MNIDKGDPHVTPRQTKHFSKQQTSLRDTAFFGLEFTIHKAGGTYGNKNRLIQQTLGRPYVSSFPLAPAAQSHPAIWCSTKNQLVGHISACKWNDLFPCNLHDLTDVFPLAAHVTRGLPALTFYKKGRLQLPAACQHQTVTFRTVRFTDLQKKASCFCPSSGSSSLMIALSRSRRRCLSSFYLAWPTQRCFSIPSAWYFNSSNSPSRLLFTRMLFIYSSFYFSRDTFLTELYWVTWRGELLPPWLSKHNLCVHFLQSVELKGLWQWLIFITGQQFVIAMLYAV